ncbi:MAG: hypothetical protein GKR89_12970 [Candidatus Latescibacteria bacterium]|nr:hypothetical protein [Candidatus Latescibacterota bacterium]
MEKSIEKIWREGFVDDDALIAPTINDLYNQKSADLIDTMTRMFRLNLIFIVVFATALLPVSFAVDLAYLGAGIFALLMGLVLVGKKNMAGLEQIDKSVSSYQYLKAFDGWLKETTAIFTRIYRFFYPAFFLTVVLGLWFSPLREKILNEVQGNLPEIYFLYGVPVFWLLGALVIAGLLGIFGGAIYKVDKNIVYGRVMKKLDEILADMEELRR